MTDHYVQLDGDFFTDGRGSGTPADPYNGPVLAELLGGWGDAPAAAGDRVFVRGTLALGRFHLFILTVGSGTFDAGDLVGNHADPAAATITARVVHVDGSDLYAWSADTIDDAFSVYNYSQSGEGFISGDQTNPGILCAVSGDDSAGHVSVLGCPPDSWVPDGTRAVLDGQSAALYCLDLAGDLLRLEHLHCTRSTSYLLNSRSGSTRHLLRNCEFSLQATSSYCVFLNYCYESQVLGCDIHDNAAGALVVNRAHIRDCAIRNNSSFGAYLGIYSSMAGCVVAGNGGDGLRAASRGIAIVGNVIDGCGGHGIDTDDANNLVLTNRLTHNGGWGVYGPAGAVSDANVYAANAAGALSTGDYGPDDRVEDDDGYVDRAGGDFTLRPDAAGRRAAVSLPDGNTSYRSAGLEPPEIRHDIQVAFPRHEVIFP